MRIVEFNVGKLEASVRGYIHDDLTPYCDTYLERPAVLICPGGGYMHVSPREADPIALPLFTAGFQVFILNYTIFRENIAISEPEEEVAEALAEIKLRAAEYFVIPERVAVLGFSAGGHLAASLCCHWKNYGEISRPDCGVLCYPVISTGRWGHDGSTEALTGMDEAKLKYYDLHTQVTKDTPSCFIWHTVEDETVNIRNSHMFVSSLIENGIPYEYHVYEKGKHGLSAGRRETGPEVKDIQTWMPLLIEWLSRRWNFVL